MPQPHDVPCNDAEKMPCHMLGIAIATGDDYGFVDEHADWI